MYLFLMLTVTLSIIIMGVPALFRWLASKYPKIVSHVIEEQPQKVDNVIIPIDISQPNPNNIELDNLYLDMNGIIHPCCHPEDKPAPETEEEMMVDIFKYMERLVNMVRPRKVLYLAIDGVAPRAKMNQQRSRRFRAAQEAQEKVEEEERIREELFTASNGTMGIKDPVEDGKGVRFDSNCITPGTPFMANLAYALRYFICKKLSQDPGWKNLKVILSDANVPGEGEHKIMDFIRRQRNSEGYDPNTRHVIYGLDADLIMLALATHEPHFKVLREDVFANEGSDRNCFVCKKPGHMAAECPGPDATSSIEEKKPDIALKPYVFLHVNILREYLGFELNENREEIPFDLERAIDDWVFMCYFVGNDFLPHLPSLEIREGALDTLTSIWKRMRPQMGDGYLTQDGDVNLERLQLIMTELGQIEDQVFLERREREERRRRSAKRRKIESARRNQTLTIPQVTPTIPAQKPEDFRPRQSNMTFAQRLKASLAKQSTEAGDEKKDTNSTGQDVGPQDASDGPITTVKAPSISIPVIAPEPVPPPALQGLFALQHAGEKRKLEESPTPALPPSTPSTPIIPNDDEEPIDTIRLWETGWKERYYRSKFKLELVDTAARREIVRAYIEGLCWVLKYYYQGVPSWKWFYPYHYAPFASDFVDIADLGEIKFELGEPFRPFEQLMGVLPAASGTHIPLPFRKLMSSTSSEILDFYPTDFDVDMDGKKFAWQGIVLLPFIEEERLLHALAPEYPHLTKEEVERNTRGSDVLIISKGHRLYKSLSTLYSDTSIQSFALNPNISGYLFGTVEKDPAFTPEALLPAPFSNPETPDVPVNQSMMYAFNFFKTCHLDSVHYANPAFEGPRFPAKLLPTVKMPATELGPADLDALRIYYERQARNKGYNGGARYTPQVGYYNNNNDRESRQSRPSSNQRQYQDGQRSWSQRGGGVYDRPRTQQPESHRGYGGGYDRPTSQQDPYRGYSAGYAPSSSGYQRYGQPSSNYYPSSLQYPQQPYGAGYGYQSRSVPPPPSGARQTPYIQPTYPPPPPTHYQGYASGSGNRSNEPPRRP